MRFSEKVCLVTGAGSGIGQAAAARLAREGGNVVVVDINPGHGNATVQTITKAGGHASFAKANVADSAEVQAAVKAVVDQWGKINWDSLIDQVDWDTALREDQGHDNPLGLYDLERHIRPVGESYRKLIQEWRSILPTESSSLRLKR